jgi:hypothetical protein
MLFGQGERFRTQGTLCGPGIRPSGNQRSLPISVPPIPPAPHLPHAPAAPPNIHRGSPLLAYIHAKFREILGEPYTTLVLDSQWSIRSDPKAPAIFVLVNGSYEKPAVWIFDPYTAENVWRTSITSSEEVDRALEEIGRRAAAAAASWLRR